MLLAAGLWQAVPDEMGFAAEISSKPSKAPSQTIRKVSPPAPAQGGSEPETVDSGERQTPDVLRQQDRNVNGVEDKVRVVPGGTPPVMLPQPAVARTALVRSVSPASLKLSPGGSGKLQVKGTNLDLLTGAKVLRGKKAPALVSATFDGERRGSERTLIIKAGAQAAAGDYALLILAGSEAVQVPGGRVLVTIMAKHEQDTDGSKPLLAMKNGVQAQREEVSLRTRRKSGGGHLPSFPGKAESPMTVREARRGPSSGPKIPPAVTTGVPIRKEEVPLGSRPAFGAKHLARSGENAPVSEEPLSLLRKAESMISELELKLGGKDPARSGAYLPGVDGRSREELNEALSNLTKAKIEIGGQIARLQAAGVKPRQEMAQEEHEEIRRKKQSAHNAYIVSLVAAVAAIVQSINSSNFPPDPALTRTMLVIASSSSLPRDVDADGIFNTSDQCPLEPGREGDGCPEKGTRLSQESGDLLREILLAAEVPAPDSGSEEGSLGFQALFGAKHLARSGEDAEVAERSHSLLKQAESRISELELKIGPSPRDGLPGRLTARSRQALEAARSKIVRGDPQEEWKADLEAALRSSDTGKGISMDVDAIAQWIMRDAYSGALRDLEGRAEKLRLLNEQKKSVREKLSQLREQLALLDDSGETQRLEEIVREWEARLTESSEEVRLASVDLQEMLQKTQGTLQMVSQLKKLLRDTALAVRRKTGGGGGSGRGSGGGEEAEIGGKSSHDDDEDGVPDSEDKCPHEPGPFTFNGCPSAP